MLYIFVFCKLKKNQKKPPKNPTKCDIYGFINTTGGDTSVSRQLVADAIIWTAVTISVLTWFY